MNSVPRTTPELKGAPAKTQRRNQRLVSAFGETMPVSEWPSNSRCAVPLSTLVERLNRGWDTERAISEKPRSNSRRSTKPKKPRKTFPLFPHANGMWCKKVRGSFYYFGPWSDPEAAEALYKEQRADLEAGRKPTVSRSTGALTIRELCNRFLTSKESRLESGELSRRTFDDYHRAAATVIEQFGRPRLVNDLTPEDFGQLRSTLAKRYGPISLLREITMIRGIFRYADKNRLIDGPVSFGSEFDRPSKKTLRIARAARGKKLFTPAEIKALLGAAGPHLRAMIYLGVNAGLGNADVGALTLESVDLDRGWLDFPRPKTGIERRCPLWDETVAAIRESMAKRPTPTGDTPENLLFVTRHGNSYRKETAGNNPVTLLFRRLLLDTKVRKTKIYRKGLGFYTLRHVTETIGGGAKDQVAVDYIMGHTDETMAAAYREGIDDERLEAVVKHIHGWLFEKE